ncbi:glycine cleavage system aminomethyltransferase GcvT [Archangium primigenium]|uniref:glycine cleavage system aminomethyltransferase GcvT n=1 Tax=[Archangium] primigenium TaxID=2792470 RepID=UPI001958BD39|nr:glycine cleavage system aminomethyltransferase GcvT [Archangium primigenium]MBM7115374.1 glycine cleavage system aminomethyltransferase GcvT [Archangium primigenium]
MARQTPLNAVHRELGGRMVDFAGWDMPVQYSSIIGEHETVRTAVGLFDVSHMGEIEFSGPGALETANKLITNDLSKCADGQALYAGLLNDAGGFVDDVVAYRFSPERILIVVNASNKDKDFAWMRARAEGVQPVDRSDDYAQIAVQGPKAVGLVQRLTPVDLTPVGTYRFTEGPVAGIACIISRTGYTGEDGFELYCAPGDAAALWRALLKEGEADGVKPCGLGARDSLRVEMKYALYGNDIDETHTALEAGLGWICKLDKAGGFIGRDALVKQKAEGVKRKLVGLEVTGSGIARHGYPLLKDGQRVGEVTSGTQGPSVKKPIAFGYVPVELAAEGATLDVEIRGRAVPVVVVKTPFLKKK